eukprot:SAG11_NODE_6669_length_1270_cov_3.258753_1_plen_85_part_00
MMHMGRADGGHMTAAGGPSEAAAPGQQRSAEALRAQQLSIEAAAVRGSRHGYIDRSIAIISDHALMQSPRLQLPSSHAYDHCQY